MGKILKPNELDPSLMRHACIAAAGFAAGISILDKDEMIAVLREAVTTPAKDAAELSTLRAENGRLRERCEAAEKLVRRFYDYHTSSWSTEFARASCMIMLLADVETWLPDSKNKGGE